VVQRNVSLIRFHQVESFFRFHVSRWFAVCDHHQESHTESLVADSVIEA